MYIYQLWNNEDGGPGADQEDWDLLRLGYDLNDTKDTIVFSEKYISDYGLDSGTVYTNKYIFKR